MLTRIVRLSFEPSKIDDFLKIFNDSKPKIEAREGCKGVRLMQDYNLNNVFYTYSTWESQEDLNAYRNSELFGGVWKSTKALFNDKPLAYSLKEVE